MGGHTHMLCQGKLRGVNVIAYQIHTFIFICYYLYLFNQFFIYLLDLFSCATCFLANNEYFWVIENLLFVVRIHVKLYTKVVYLCITLCAWWLTGYFDFHQTTGVTEATKSWRMEHPEPYTAATAVHAAHDDHVPWPPTHPPHSASIHCHTSDQPGVSSHPWPQDCCWTRS